MSKNTCFMYSFGMGSKSISAAQYEYADKAKDARLENPEHKDIGVFCDLVNLAMKDESAYTTVNYWSLCVTVSDDDDKWIQAALRILADIAVASILDSP